MATGPALLLVDNDAVFREQMKWALTSDYDLMEASDRSAALSQIRRDMPPLVLLDLGLSPDVVGTSEGLVILRETLRLNPVAKVIVVTSNSDRANAVAAVENGAYDVIEKPVQLDVLKVVLQRATYLSNLDQESRAIQERAVMTEFEGLMGNSKPMQDVFGIIRRVGP